MAPDDPASIDHARKRAMARFEEGEIPEALAELTRLIDAPAADRGARSRQALYYLRLDRATVLRRANRWDEAMADLDEAERLIDGLAPLFQDMCRGSVAHARALILGDPANPGADPTRCLGELARIRRSGFAVLECAADDLESRLAHRAGDWTTAAALARRAAASLDDQGWPAAAATCRRREAEALLGRGDVDGAEAALDAARRHFDRFGTPLDLAHAELVRARILSARHAHDEAWHCTLDALARFDHLIHRFSVLSEQQAFLRDKLERYAEAFAVALAAGGDTGCLRAWSVAERSKSFYLCQLLASGSVALFEGVDPARLRAFEEAGDTLDRLDAQLGRLSRDDREGEPGQQLIARLHDASREKARALESLMRADPRWARVNVPGELDVGRELARMPGGWSLISYYWEGAGGGAESGGGREPGRLHVFWTDGSSRPCHTVTEWAPPDMELLRASRTRLTGRVPRGATLVPEALGALILPPEVCGSIPEGSRLLVSPHGLLQMLPIHAVVIDSQDFAAGRWAIQYLPTLALLPLARQSNAPDPVLLIGCEQDGFGDRPLPDVPGELRALEEVWSEPPARPVTRHLVPRDGTPDAAGAEVGRWGGFGVLHVACHGDLPADRPFDASLRLGSSSVRSSDFFGIRLDGAIVTLSACSLGRHAEGARDRAVMADEWIGLCLPLLYAGARCVVASTWEAFSEPAARFMRALHAALKRGDDPADAVRWAQDRTASEIPFPAAWANWYPVGVPAGPPGRR